MNDSISFRRIKLSVAFLFSGMALLLFIFLKLHLIYSLILFLAPASIIFYSTFRQLNISDKFLLRADIINGVRIGILGTIAYDVVRICLYLTGMVKLFPFETFRVFGNALAGSNVSYNTAFAIGTCYHLLNGITFSIAYRICLKNKNFGFGIVSAMGLELLMLFAYPNWLNLNGKMGDFLIISITGHFSYGATVGLLNQYKFKSKNQIMKWATRKNLKVDRVACIWLIRKFIDANAEIIFVKDEEIKALTLQGYQTFDAEFAKYSHDEDYQGGKYGERCTFQILLDEFDLIKDNPALERMGKILNAADIGHRIGVFEPKSGFGLWVIAQGFSLTTPDDEEKLLKEIPIYDAIYAYCEKNDV